MLNKTDIFSALDEPAFSGGVVTNVKSAQKLMSMIIPSSGNSFKEKI